MQYFYFNDSFPKKDSKSELTNFLISILPEYKKISTKFKNEIAGIVTNIAHEKIILTKNGFTLEDIIKNISSREERNYAFSLFRNSPIDKYFEIKDKYFEKNYYYIIDSKIIEAQSLAIAGLENGIIFSLSLYNELKQNTLKIYSEDSHNFEIINFYGDILNTEFIINHIDNQLQLKLQNFEKLISILGSCKYSKKFEKSYKELNFEVQISVIQHFIAAINRKGISKFYADKNLIRDVTPEKSAHSIFELRIFSPFAYRIYFNESTDLIYLAMIEKKPAPNVQNNDIKTAKNIIEKLIEP